MADDPRSDASGAAPDGPLDLPLFPLGTVVFPGGVLPLRIFEQRYFELVKRCVRDGTGFGVVPIRSGGDALRERDDALPEIYGAGTFVRISDFDALDDGQLGIRCVGAWKFRVSGAPWEEGRVMHARVVPMPEEASSPLPLEAAGMVDLLRQVSGMEDFEARLPSIDYDDARQVGWRLAEVLPLGAGIQHELLVLDDALERLALLSRLITVMQAREPQ